MLLYGRHELENTSIYFEIVQDRCRSKSRIGMGEPSQELIAICFHRFAYVRRLNNWLISVFTESNNNQFIKLS